MEILGYSNPQIPEIPDGEQPFLGDADDPLVVGVKIDLKGVHVVVAGVAKGVDY